MKTATKMTRIEELKAELATKMAAKKAQMAELVETIKVEKELKRLDSPMYEERMLVKTDLDKLESYIQVIRDEYARDDRKMSLVFGYGTIPNKLLAILKSVQFSKMEEKTNWLDMLNIDEVLLEDVLTAFGNTAYFSKASVEIVKSQPMDIDAVKKLLTEVANAMGLVSTVNLGSFNDVNVAYQYDRAQLKAEEMFHNTQEFIEQAVNYAE